MSEFFGLWKRQNIPACTNSVRVFITLMLETIRKKKKKKKKKKRIHRGRIQFRSSAPEIWQSCSPSISSNGADDQRCGYGHIDIAEEDAAVKTAKRSTEVYLLSDVSVDLRLKLCIPLQDVRLFIHILPAQNQRTRAHVSPSQGR